jgi:hypothetical protein
MLANVDRQFWAVRAKLYRLRQVMITDVLKQADVVGCAHSISVPIFVDGSVF